MTESETIQFVRQTSTQITNTFTSSPPATVVFEDVVLDDDPFSIEIDEVEDITAFDQLSKQVASKISVNSGRSAVWKEYRRYYDDTHKKLEEMLEAHFPNRWSFQVLYSIDSFEQLVTPDVRSLAGLLGSNSLGSTAVERLVIHFPTVRITNGRQHHTIKELFVVINLNYRFSITSGIKCFRALKTVREYKCSYNHSHAKKTNNELAHFCLGSTPLDSLMVDLSTRTFNELQFDLLLQQLPDYLAWESLDGGPYVKMQELQQIQMGVPQVPTIGTHLYEHVMDQLIATRPKLDISVSSNNGRIGDIVVRKTMELWRQLSEFVPENLLFPYTEGSSSSVYPAITDGMTDEQIRRFNNSIVPSTIEYKGQGLCLQLELNQQEGVPEVQVELLADHRILNNVVIELSKKIFTHANDVYWYGIECSKESSVSKN